MKLSLLRHAAIGVLGLGIVHAAAIAQGNYPSRTIRLIVPFAPGGTSDVVARLIADPLTRALGQTVVIDNRAGAGGAIGTSELVRAQPDGYTFALATPSTTAAGPAFNPTLSYRPTDFAAVTDIAATPTVIAVNSGFPARNYAAFLKQIKQHPGAYSYASSGTGGISHLQMESFKSLTGTFITHIPYKGAGPALSDTMSGQVNMVMDALPSAWPFIKSGGLMPIVVAAPHRLPILPNVPTFAEVGLPSLNGMSYFGMIAPKNTPKEIIEKVHAAVVAALADPNVRKRIEDSGSVPVGNTPAQFAAEMAAEYSQLTQVVHKQKLTFE
jgi:tripartite-type tricarboxylate transporter receptor subunit TctC